MQLITIMQNILHDSVLLATFSMSAICVFFSSLLKAENPYFICYTDACLWGCWILFWFVKAKLQKSRFLNSFKILLWKQLKFVIHVRTVEKNCPTSDFSCLYLPLVSTLHAEKSSFTSQYSLLYFLISQHQTWTRKEHCDQWNTKW